jgi:LysR family transcriptional regulator of gallate degradation
MFLLYPPGMSHELNFRHLEVVAAVARHGGVHRAAAQVNLSQPAISQAVASVERTVAAALFDRVTNGMLVTDAGRVFTKRIDQAIGYLKSGAQAIATRKAGKGAGSPRLDRLATTVQLRSLIEVIERGGYAPAARHLGVSQPNVYRAIKDLEVIAGRKLFEPSPFGARPTAEALILARWASLAFREIALGMDDVRELRGVRDGSLIIGALPLVRTSILPAAVTRLLAQFPDAKVKILDGAYAELLTHLQHGRIDLIIGTLRNPPPANNLKQEELFQEVLSIVVRANHPMLKSGRLDVAKLVELEWIAPPEGTPARVIFSEFFRRHGYTHPKRVIECSSFITMRDLLVRCDRAALLSASQIQRETLTGELAIAVAALPGTERPIGICTRLDWSPTKIQASFLNLARELAQPNSAGTLAQG